MKSESLQAIWFSYLILDWHNNLPAFSCYMLQLHQQYSMFKVKICSTTHSLYLFDLVFFKLFFFSHISSQKKCLVLIHWSLLDVHVSCTEEYNLTKMLLYISCRRRWCHFNGLLGTPLSSHVIPAPWLIKYAMLTRHHLFSCFFFLFVEDEQSAPACPPLSPLVPPFSPSPYMCYLPVAIPPGTGP